MLAPVRTVAPAALPVELDEVKQSLRVEHSDDDEALSRLIAAAAARLDGYYGVLGRALITQTWRQSFGAFTIDCGRPLRLAVGPLQSVSSVTYYDGSNVSQTLGTDIYRVLTDAIGPFVALVPGQSWPDLYSRADAITITYIAGLAADAASLAVAEEGEAIRAVITMMVQQDYDGYEEQRQRAIDNMLTPHRRVKF